LKNELPQYLKEIPPPLENFTEVLELVNHKTGKIRLISCTSKAQAKNFISLFNLIGAYRKYQAILPDDDGPDFITEWV
jgi:hypothetical protein